MGILWSCLHHRCSYYFLTDRRVISKYCPDCGSSWSCEITLKDIPQVFNLLLSLKMKNTEESTTGDLEITGEEEY